MPEPKLPPNESTFLADVKTMFSMTPGDWGCLTQLFFDNLSTLLGALFAIQGLANVGADISADLGLINYYIFGKIVPGVGVTLLTGNVYYSWQASRLTNRWGRQYTAQPYGLNTPAAFSFVFNIMYPVYFSLVFTEGSEVAFKTAYDVALAANFITGLISTVLAFFGPLILQYVPPAALLVPIAGIGIAFLGMEQVTNSIAAPLVGYPSMLFVFLGWYAGVRLGFGNYRLPEALQVIMVGVIMGWSTGLNKKQTVEDAAELVKWYGPDWSADDMFKNFDLIKDYLGIVIPIGISATATTLMCLVSAKNAGDPFPVRESMIVDGIGTMIASFFGSPFGTVIYIGHPAHKRSGAKTGYSMLNGVIYFAMSLCGVLAFIQSIVNVATIGPIVLFVGLAINEECLNFIPSRHYAAYIVGLFPSIFDWVVNVSNRSPLIDDKGENMNFPGGEGWFGILAWKRGALLISFVWVAILVNVIDRQWNKATFWSLLASAFALFGIIHMPEAGLDSLSDPFWEQCPSGGSCWEHGEQWMYFVAYLMFAGIFILIELARKYGGDEQLLPGLDDPTSDEFKDWFRDAEKVTHTVTKTWRDELEEKRLDPTVKQGDKELGSEEDDESPAEEDA